MIRVTKDFDLPPAALQSQVILDAIVDLIANGNMAAIQSDLYRGRTTQPSGEVRFEVVEALMLLYHDKCAYCESKEFDPQVEHYRPKGRVIGARGHLGYYWLAFEWSNLVSTCFDCNKVGKGKGNRFPLLGGESGRVRMPPLLPNNLLDTAQTRALHPLLLAEQPSLLHPEIDQPENCFMFDNQGTMTGIDPTGRGQATIKICNLNRKNLLYRRQRILDGFIQPIRDACMVFVAGIINNEGLESMLGLVFRRIREWGSPSQEFSLFGKQTFENFQVMVVPLLLPEIQSRVLQIFEQYRLSTN